ncbi:20S proteasome, regulatory subunit beta type PSMB2/PRE1 [Pseudoloma neurophilia]|uniref:20S proteasome, regulatory subunit beta type PSMB2/PRE1 n=1 Tax=Pseudoloma neurophilia TaxID=146866 RepID=A0A0R0M199_9MICR|nr:20S proteasome, regulatory subunit beta type PSMB2/PRE1 [Pseudoloma neurophilia]
MDNLIGLKANSHVLIASDMSVSRSILNITSEHDKFYNINDKVIFAHCGEFGDAVGRKEFFLQSIKLNQLNNDIDINLTTTANYIQNHVHKSLRTRNPCKSSYMLMDCKSLCSVDNNGLLLQQDYICQGYASLFLYGLLDKKHRLNMSVFESISLLTECLKILKEKLMIGHLCYKVMIMKDDMVRSIIIRI